MYLKIILGNLHSLSTNQFSAGKVLSSSDVDRSSTQTFVRFAGCVFLRKIKCEEAQIIIITIIIL